jgi:hypothetical protein
LIRGLPLLEQTAEAEALADSLLHGVPFPERAAVDALHVGISAVQGMDYVLTWNCTHIANASLRPGIESVCRKHGYEPPIICTPDELLQQEGNEDG